MVLCYYCKEDGYIPHDEANISVSNGKRVCPLCGKPSNTNSVGGRARKGTAKRGEIEWRIVINTSDDKTTREYVSAGSYSEAVEKGHKTIPTDHSIISVSPYAASKSS